MHILISYDKKLIMHKINPLVTKIKGDKNRSGKVLTKEKYDIQDEVDQC